MGKRDVTIYTCDGCNAQSTVPKGETVLGFTRVALHTDRGGDMWLCTVCYGAVEWVMKFQRVTLPPKVFEHDGRYSLRKEKP